MVKVATVVPTAQLSAEQLAEKFAAARNCTSSAATSPARSMVAEAW